MALYLEAQPRHYSKATDMLLFTGKISTREHEGEYQIWHGAEILASYSSWEKLNYILNGLRWTIDKGHRYFVFPRDENVYFLCKDECECCL